jgi:ketosteroid isomerase-like protein
MAPIPSVGVADRLSVLELHARYAHAIDAGDAPAWADCFTPDGVLRTNRPIEIRGRADLVAFASAWYAETSGTRRHMTWHHLVDAEGSEIVGRCYAAILRTGEAGVCADFTAVYRDRFARTPDGWLLRERAVEIDRWSPGGDVSQ